MSRFRPFNAQLASPNHRQRSTRTVLDSSVPLKKPRQSLEKISSIAMTKDVLGALHFAPYDNLI
jgi:hypothetical protein